MRPINTLIVHCSASPFGNAELIRGWHVQRGFKDVGYHYIILNGYPDGEHWSKLRPVLQQDGVIETGRPLDRIGAHSKGHNRDSVGVCLVGDRAFTGRQLEALRRIYLDLLDINPALQVLGHCEVEAGKTCPNLDMDWVRQYLNDQ
jgi:hypothetical protein